MTNPLPPGRPTFTSFLIKRPLAAFMITWVLVGGLTSYYDPLWNKKVNDPFWNTYKPAPP